MAFGDKLSFEPLPLVRQENASGHACWTEVNWTPWEDVCRPDPTVGLK